MHLLLLNLMSISIALADLNQAVNLCNGATGCCGTGIHYHYHSTIDIIIIIIVNVCNGALDTVEQAEPFGRTASSYMIYHHHPCRQRYHNSILIIIIVVLIETTRNAHPWFEW